jgi:hypothetical protein
MLNDIGVRAHKSSIGEHALPKPKLNIRNVEVSVRPADFPRPNRHVARQELARVDPQLAIEKMGGITRAGRRAYRHANPLPFGVGGEQLAFDPGRDLFPFRLGPALRRRQHRPPSPRRCVT